jgi:uncharacterized protein YqjF (DUF2071 family)
VAGGDDEAPFLTATWRHLAFLNYEVDPALLTARLPLGTELDTWHGRALVSLIGLRFLDLRVLGRAIPGHQAFDQVNLRFYVRRPVGDGDWRRGVVFVKEIVPKRLIAGIARLWYREPYARLPTRHTMSGGAPPGLGPFIARYEWRHRGRWQAISGHGAGQPAVFAPGSVEEFITERYWGYRARPAGPTTEFGTRHPPWRVWALRDPCLEGDVAPLLGGALSRHLAGAPHSAFLADGSAVAVYPPRPFAVDTPPGAAA